MLHRLSVYVLFVDWGDTVEVRQTATGASVHATRDEHTRLLEYAGFIELRAEEQRWIGLQVLVPPGADAEIVPGPGTEAALAAAVARWYWEHEVESERGYTWLGVPIVKSGPEVMLYQEMIASGARRIIEIGSGDGGGLVMLTSLLGMSGGGEIVGIELDPLPLPQILETISTVHVSLTQGNALQTPLPAGRFDLVIIDVGTDAARQFQLADRYFDTLASAGSLAFEDATGTPGFLKHLDDFLLLHPTACVAPRARRHPLAKLLALSVRPR